MDENISNSLRMSADFFNRVFDECILNFHKKNDIHEPFINIYPGGNIESFLYQKCWIDSVQWHLEDLIRDDTLPSKKTVGLKRWIDRQNQERTDMVEKIDDWFLHYFRNCRRKKTARMNSETPAWLLDRISILCLKIYHMKEQSERADANENHRAMAKMKLNLLLEQHRDLSICFDELIHEILRGNLYMKVYRQMKMYNDRSLNPVLYSNSHK